MEGNYFPFLSFLTLPPISSGAWDKDVWLKGVLSSHLVEYLGNLNCWGMYESAQVSKLRGMDKGLCP